jgi:periplasmic protein TonB
MESKKILSADLLDILFENRNKEYGAYQLRKTYNSRIRKSLMITGSLALIALLSSFVAGKIDKANERVKKTEITLAEITPEEKIIEPPPPKTPVEPPRVEMIQFTPPVITKDEKVPDDEKPPEQDDLDNVKIDVKNQEGVIDDIPNTATLDKGKDVLEEKKKEDEPDFFEKVEIEASYPGGFAAWKKYLENNLKNDTPSDNAAPEGVYKVNIRFKVDKEGNVSDITPLTKLGYGLEEEAIRVIKKSNKWTPGNQNGKAVGSYHTQTIAFVVGGE